MRVLVVGDLMLDQFVWGRVERISPEAPVPVVHVTREEARPGGAGNVVEQRRGARRRAPTSAGIVGATPPGARLRAVLAALGAATDGVVGRARGATTQKTRIIAHHQQVVRLDREDGAAADGARGAPAARLRARARSRAPTCWSCLGLREGRRRRRSCSTRSRRRTRAAPFTWVIDPEAGRTSRTTGAPRW